MHTTFANKLTTASDSSTSRDFKFNFKSCFTKGYSVTYLIQGQEKGRTITPSWYQQCHNEWVSSVSRPRQHSIGYTGDGFYRSKDPTNSIKVLKEML